MCLVDKFGRAITDLRISITDRCNYKCVYCRTGNEGAIYGDLPFPVYLRIIRLFASAGIKKVRITGGEPLLRKGLIDFVRAVDPNSFARITRVPTGFAHVLAGIRAAKRAGLDPVKINCVLMRGFNDNQIVPFGKFAREEAVVVRFIEFMPLEEGRVWSSDVVVTMKEILRRMAEYLQLVEIPHGRSETARRYVFEDGIGEIGIIAPVSQPFCGHCSRIRITSDGKIRTCLFSVWDHDLHELIRRGASDDELLKFIHNAVGRKEERHHIGEARFVPPSRTMVHIGG
jgi:GTP 3',8-cyclase